ncbi:MAG: hypothetical protein U0324_30120 [Polyangiales bacterium]
MSTEERKSGHPEGPEHERVNLFERIVKKGIESGIGAFSKSEDTVRSLIDNVKLPKEAATLLIEQVDETKRGLYQVVAKEIRDFLQTTNFAGDVKKILTGLAFEVKMEVRFKPTEDEQGASTVRPDVRGDVALKSTRKRTKTAPAPEPPAPPRDPPAEE